MILLRLISWPYVRKHLLRTLLTTAGIVLGVGVLIGMRTANESVMGSFQSTVDKIAGATQLQVTVGDTGFEEEALERVEGVPGVRVASAVIEAVAATGLPGQGNLMILGVDMTSDRGLRDYDLESGDEAVIDDPLVFLAQPDSIIVTREFAERNRLQVNSRIPMITMDGKKEFTIRGVMRAGGMASAFGGNLAIMDVYAAEKVFGRGRRFDRIDLAVKEGYTVPGVQAALAKLLGPGFTVEAPSNRGTQFESMLSAHRISINVSSVFALLIGMFIIYNSFSIAVTQRRYEIGILRALGATRRQIRTLFLMESLVEGIVGSIAGLGLGLLLARGMMGYIGSLIESVYGVEQTGVHTLAVDPRLLAGSVVVGILTSMFAAWIPASEASRVNPVVALQKGKAQAISGRETQFRRWTAIAFIVVAASCLLFGAYRPIFYFGFLLTISGALLLTPTIALGITRAIRPLLCKLRPVEGALAADALIQAPRRTAGTVAALMLSLTMVIGFGGMAVASYHSITGWMEIALNPDLVVATSDNLASRTFRFPARLGEELKTVEGVGIVQDVTAPRIIYRNRPVLLVAVEIESLGRTARRKPLLGDTDDMYRRTAAGEGVMVADNLALLNNLHLGEIVEIPTPSGLLKLPIVGVVEDYSDQSGTFLIDREVYKRYWKDDSCSLFRVYVKKGASPLEVRQRILDRFGGQSKLFVFTNQDLRSYIIKVTDQWFGMSYAQVFVAIFVAILGIVNTLTVSITDRRRELGVLQAVGALRSQIRHTIWMEAVSVGLVGLLMGLGLGAIYLYYILQILRHDVAGLRLAYEFPVKVALLLFPIILGAAFLSALGPAESAVRGSLVEALEYE
jgi:putative ABC transport system permease protein